MKKAPRRARLKNSEPAPVLKVEPERQLSVPVAARALRQHRRQGAELRIVDVRLGWREIQAVNGVGKRRFEAQPVALADAEVLRQSQICADEVWPLQGAHATIAKSAGAGGRRHKGIEVVEILSTLTCSGISDAVRTGNRPAAGSRHHIRVGLIVSRTHSRRQPLTRLHRRNRAEIPASQHVI